MKHVSTILSFSLFFSTLSAQVKSKATPDYTKTIKAQATDMGALLIKKDFKPFVKYTYPKIVEMMGGEKQMVATMDTSFMEMEKQGTKFLKVDFGEPSKIISYEKELQCIIPQTIELKVPTGRMILNSSLIAISLDGGKNWYFIDSSGKDVKTLKPMLPNLSDDLVIPPAQEPTMIKE